MIFMLKEVSVIKILHSEQSLLINAASSRCSPARVMQAILKMDKIDMMTPQQANEHQESLPGRFECPEVPLGFQGTMYSLQS